MSAARQSNEAPQEGGANAVPTPSIDAAAARWVSRQQAGLDESTEHELVAWRAGDPRHEEAFLRLAALSAAFVRARQTGAAKIMAIELAARGRQRGRRRALSAAGMVAALAIGAGIYFTPARSPDRLANARLAPAFESMRRLPDGSMLELNGNADIAVRFEPALRRVELRRGEVLFHVAKNPERPFIVQVGGIEVRAVGTAFNVRLEGGTVEVLVTEGKVGLDDAIHGGSLLPVAPGGGYAPLTAGQRALIETVHPDAVRITQVNPPEMERRLAWRTAHIEFDGIDLAFAVAQMNRRNAVQIEIADEVIARLLLSGAFPANDPETFARLVAETFGLKEESRSDGVIVLHQP